VIPWWGWLAIWACLAVALLAVLATSAVRLFHKGLGVLKEIEVLVEKTELLGQAAEAAEEHRTELAIRAGAEPQRRSRAVIREAALERRVARQRELVERAQEITHRDVRSTLWFTADEQPKPVTGGNL